MRSEMAMRPRAATPGAWPDNLNRKEVIQHMQNTTPPGFVYLIHAVGTNRVKIGFSANPEKRLKELQTGSPFELKLLAKWPGTLDTELSGHRTFADYHCIGEWFELEVEGIVPMVEAGLHLDLPYGDKRLRLIARTLRDLRDFGCKVQVFSDPNGLIIQLPNVAICQKHKMMHFGQKCPIC